MRILQIETINSCNARCVFCPLPTAKEHRAPMTMDLFRKIILDAMGIHVETVMPFQNGEPFLDQHIFERIAFVNDTLPDSKVALYSNGALLDERKSQELSKLNIAWMHFSINAVSDRERETVMGIPLERTIENILRFQKMNPNTTITVSAIQDPAIIAFDDIQKFSAFWSSKGIKPMLFNNGNWAGKMRKSYNVNSCCTRPSNDMVILSNGEAVLCCYDSFGEVVFGDVNKQSVKDVWESEERKKYALFNLTGRRSELPLCNQCTTG